MHLAGDRHRHAKITNRVGRAQADALIDGHADDESIDPADAMQEQLQDREPERGRQHAERSRERVEARVRGRIELHEQRAAACPASGGRPLIAANESGSMPENDSA